MLQTQDNIPVLVDTIRAWLSFGPLVKKNPHPLPGWGSVWRPVEQGAGESPGDVTPKR